jgi:hypothetical protein
MEAYPERARGREEEGEVPIGEPRRLAGYFEWP